MPKLEIDEEVKQLVKEGKNAPQIAKELGIGLTTVKRRKKELGLSGPIESDVKKWIEQHPEVRRVFGSLSNSSKRNYYAYFKVYSEWTGKDPKDLWVEPWETIRDRIVDFRLLLEEQGKAPNTIAAYTTCIRRFYEYNNIIFKGKFFTNGKGKQVKEQNEKELITPQMLREILEIATPMEKAMFISQFQSGLGANELCNLKIKDVAKIEDSKVNLRIEDGLIKLKLIRGKTNVKFITFLGHDAIEFLQKWIDLRQSGKVLLNRELSEGAKIKSKDDFLFVAYAKREREWSGITPTTYAKYLRNRVRQLGWISDDNMKERGQLNAFRPHALRMSFSVLCKHKAKLKWDFVEHMLGHKFGMTDSAYIKFDEEELKKAYKEAEPFLSLTPIEAIVSDDKYRELKMENELLKRRIEEIEAKTSSIDLANLKDILKDTEVRDYLVELLAQKIVAKRDKE